jgi:hypothetical protein
MGDLPLEFVALFAHGSPRLSGGSVKHSQSPTVAEGGSMIVRTRDYKYGSRHSGRELFRRPQSRRRYPSTDVGGNFRLPRPTEHFVTLTAQRQRPGFVPDPLRVVRDPLVQGSGMLSSSALHGTLHFLRGN